MSTKTGILAAVLSYGHYGGYGGWTLQSPSSSYSACCMPCKFGTPSSAKPRLTPSHRITHQEHSIQKMTALWLLPIITLIVSSSSGGLVAHALIPHSPTAALIGTAFSLTMVLMGLSFALMVITIFFLRLVTSGPPEPALILSSFIVLGPLGQGGFSLLVNGQNLSELLPLHMGSEFPAIALAGQILFAGCFLGAYVLFSMGMAWTLLSIIATLHVRARSPLPFSMAYWGLIFPNGVYALLCAQLAQVLDSPTYRVIGAIWIGMSQLSLLCNSVPLTLCSLAVGVSVLWFVVFLRSIPTFIDGSIFKAPYVPDNFIPKNRRMQNEAEKNLGSEDTSATSTMAL